MKSLVLLSMLITANMAFAEAPFCVSHRALGYGAFENSLSALELASSHDADAIEFDLKHTKGKKTIIFHDNNLKRLAKGEFCPLKNKVSELNLESIKSNCKLLNDENIPTFEEGLEVLSRGESMLFIEFKDKIITKEDIETIKKYYFDRPEKIAIISFYEEILNEVKEQSKTDSFLAKIKTVRLKKYGFFGGTESADFLSTKYIHRARVKKLQKEGLLIGAYTKDKKSKINKYLDKGLNFITTNDPILCQDIVNKRK